MKSYKTINDKWILDIFKEPDKVGNSEGVYNYVPLVFRASRLRANAISKVPIRIFSKDESKNEMDWPYQTDSKRFMWITEMSVCINGAAYWTPVNRGNVIIDYEYLNPYDMTVKVDKTAKDGYAIYFSQTSTGEKWINVPRRGIYELLYFHEFNLQSPWLPGTSMASNALGDVQLIQYLQRFASHFFENGAQPTAIVSMDNVSDDEVKRVEGWFKRKITGIGNAFNTLGVRSPFDVKFITPPLKDLVIPELHEQARRNTALSFEIPITMLEDAANFATAISGREGYYEDTVIPRSGQFMGDLNEQLFSKLNQVAVQDFYELSMFQEDESQRANVASSYYAITGDKVLAFELAGVELSVEQLARLEKIEEPEPEPKPENKPVEQTENKPDEQPEDEIDQADEDMKRWKKVAINRVKKGKFALCEFESEHITAKDRERIEYGLKQALTIGDVVAVFEVPTDPTGISEKLEKLINGLYLLTEGANEPV